jgi:hypothetical protein
MWMMGTTFLASGKRTRPCFSRRQIVEINSHLDFVLLNPLRRL